MVARQWDLKPESFQAQLYLDPQENRVNFFKKKKHKKRLKIVKKLNLTVNLIERAVIHLELFSTLFILLL